MRAIALALVASLAAGAAVAESLGEYAAREKQRKERERDAARPPRVFTDDDLKKDKPPATEGGNAAGAPEATSSGETGTSSVGDRADEANPQKGEWQQRAKATAQELAEAKAALAKVQARLDQLKSPFRATNPYGHGNPEVPVAEQELAQVQQRLAEAEKARADFDREVAESRIPSRWLQEP